MLNFLKTACSVVISTLVIASCGGRITDQPNIMPPGPEPVVPIPIPTREPNINPNPINNYIDLKVLSFNVWGLPNPVTSDLKNRFNRLPLNLEGYNIVNLQETFSDNIKPVLENVSYPHKFRMDNGSFLALNSGLSVLSKYPIVKKGFFKFKDCGGSDCFANKGVLFIRLNIPEFGDVDIYNTHYQAIISKEDLRIEANKELNSFIQKNEAGNLTILSGDFNFANPDITDSKSRAFKDFKARFNPIDTFRAVNPNVPGFTSDPGINKYSDKSEPPQRLDYIFVLPENRGYNGNDNNYKVEVLNSKVVFTTPVDGLFLSDHFGVATTLRLHLNK